MPERILVFDMDGVLVDVGESYRETIRSTVEHFTGKRIACETIQEYKNKGGWNNDWALSQRIAADLGVNVPYETVVKQFQKLFLGSNGDGSGGLIMRERWIPEPGLLERLAERYRFAIFTGRIRIELGITLSRWAPRICFEPSVCTEDVIEGKPSPEGLLKIVEHHPGAELVFIGDTVDDARSARAAGVPFIGIASAENPRRAETVALFETEQAIAVLESVNQLEAALAR
ncbi:MAG: HAD-IA family hydrolase [Bryobacteraceae bacterium]|nr:HAD-IA family hydrolase [Bryobacteraceae bacterium]